MVVDARTHPESTTWLSAIATASTAYEHLGRLVDYLASTGRAVRLTLRGREGLYRTLGLEIELPR